MNRLQMFRSTAAAAALLIGCYSVTADQPAAKEAAPADISGNWELKMAIPGRPTQESSLKVEKAGDKYIGVLTGKQSRLSPGGRPTPVKDFEYKDGTISFKMLFERGGQKTELVYSAKVTGESLKGLVSITGRPFKINLDGNRESPVEGLWKITLTLDSGEKLVPSIQVKRAGKQFAGEYVGIHGKKVAIKEVKFENGEVTFEAPDRADDDLLFHYDGKLSGDKLTGTVWWLQGNKQKQTIKFEAEKSRQQTAEVAGTWKLKVPMKNMPTDDPTLKTAFEPTLNLTQTGSAVKGTYVGANGETQITDGIVLGEELSFEVNRQKDGKSFKLRYQGKVDGDTLKGSVDYNFDGIMGAIDYEGKRVTPGATTKP